MTETMDDRIVCHLKMARIHKKLSQNELAERVGIKRQAIYDLESGRYLPNTLIALRLAKELDCRVEDLFILNAAQKTLPVTRIDTLSVSDTRVSLVHIRNHLIAFPTMDGKWLHGNGFHAADGMMVRDGKTVQLLQPEESLKKNILLLGCDPAFALLDSHISRHSGNYRVYCRFASSHAAVKALADGQTHVAGTHLHNSDAGESNIRLVQKFMARTDVMLVAFSMFEEGLMVASGNPLHIRSASDLAKNDVRIVNRETGAALRLLLEDWLAQAGVPLEAVSGYDRLVTSHNQGAQMVLYNLADAALGLRAVAIQHGLGFIPIRAVRCDLVIPCDFLELPAVKILLDVLQTHAIRRELSALPGYDASCTGNLIGEINAE